MPKYRLLAVHCTCERFAATNDMEIDCSKILDKIGGDPLPRLRPRCSTDTGNLLCWHSIHENAGLGRVPICAVSKDIISFLSFRTKHTFTWSLILSAISLRVRTLSGNAFATSGL